MEQIGRMIKIICFGLIKFDLSAHIHNVAQKSTDTNTYALCMSLHIYEVEEQAKLFWKLE